MAQGTEHRPPSTLQLSIYCCNIWIDKTALQKQIPISMNYFKIHVFHVFLKKEKIGIMLTFGKTCSLVFSSWISSWADSQQQGEFWKPCDWNYLHFLGSSYAYAVYEINIKSGLHHELRVDWRLWQEPCPTNILFQQWNKQFCSKSFR